MSESSELPVSVADLASCGCGGDRLPSVIKGMRYLCAIGVAPEDVADALYSNPGVLHALEDGDYLRAQDFVMSAMEVALTTVRRAGIKEDRLWLLTEAGLALGEISWAIRNIGGFHDNITRLSLDAVKKHAESTYEFFRTGRSTRRTTRTTRRGGITTQQPEPNGTPESWFEHYSKIVKNAEKLRAESPQPHPEPSVFGRLGDPNDTYQDLLDEITKRVRR